MPSQVVIAMRDQTQLLPRHVRLPTWRFPSLSILCDRLRRRLPMVSYHHMQYAIQRQMRELNTAVVFGLTLMVYISWPRFVRRNSSGYRSMPICMTYGSKIPREAQHNARLAALWEPRILHHATRVLCMTEAMQKHYEKKYGIQSELLPHCIADRDLDSAPTALRPPQRKRPTVLFVGAVSDANEPRCPQGPG